jgi:cytochrome c551/c552
MRRPLPLFGLAALVLALAGCGGEQVASPAPETVVGSVPEQTATQATTGGGGGTTTGGGGGGTTTGGGGGGTADGKTVFASNGCGSCHTYGPAGTNGKIGPDLDNLAQFAKKANQPLDKFTRESITMPDAYVEQGYQAIMPSFAQLPKPQLDALVKFLTQKR